jgi:hypothetical protein
MNLLFKKALFWLLCGGLVLAGLWTWIWWTSPKQTPFDLSADQAIASLHPVRASSAGTEVQFTGISLEEESTPQGRPEGRPEAALPVGFFDFGRIQPTEVVQRPFLLVNRGQATLLIRRLYTTCGCTVADLSSAEIPPGQASLITITFDAGFHDVSGTTVRRGLIMETNDPLAPILEIWVQASVANG